MKKFWMISAAVCALTAMALLIRRDFDKAFIVAAIGVVAWFLNYRAQVKALIASADQKESDGNSESDEEE